MKPASELGWPQGFVVYDERDLAARDLVVNLFVFRLKAGLLALNRAVRFFRIETPMLTPKKFLKGHEETGFDLVKAGFEKHGASEMYLRPETTFGTYAAFRAMWPQEQERKKQMPICLWQYGKSFRDEQNRPMTELRFREFYQLEFQLFFAPDTKADYFGTCAQAAANAAKALTGEILCVEVPASELAHYSAATTDIYSGNREVAAVSERKDFEGARVVEVSVGLDRLAFLQGIYR